MQRGFSLLFLAQQFGDFTELGIHPRSDDYADAAAISRYRSLVSHVEPVAERRIQLPDQRPGFFDRQRFAGQRGLFHLEPRHIQ